MSINELENWLKSDKTKIIDWKVVPRHGKVALIANVYKGENQYPVYELEVTYRLHNRTPATYNLVISKQEKVQSTSYYYSMDELMTYLDKEGYLELTASESSQFENPSTVTSNVIEVNASYELKDFDSIVQEPLDDAKVKIKPFYTLNYNNVSGRYDSINNLRPVIVAVLGDYSTGEDVLKVEVSYDGDTFHCGYLYGHPRNETQTLLHHDSVSDIELLNAKINETLLKLKDKITDPRFISYGDEPTSFESDRFKSAPFGYMKNGLRLFLHAKNIFNESYSDECRAFARTLGDIDRFKVINSVSSKTVFRYRTHLINVHQTGYLGSNRVESFNSDLVNLQWGYDSDVDTWYAYIHYADSPSYAPDLIGGMIKADTYEDLFEKVLLSFAKAGLDFNVLSTAHGAEDPSTTAIQKELQNQINYLKLYFELPTLQFPWELDEGYSTDSTKVFKLNEHTTWASQPINKWGDFVYGLYVPGNTKVYLNEIRIKRSPAGYLLGTEDYFYNGGVDKFFGDCFAVDDFYFPTLDDVNEFLTSNLLTYVIQDVLNGKVDENELKIKSLVEVSPTKESSQIEFEELNEVVVDAYAKPVKDGVIEFELRANTLSDPLLHLQLNLVGDEPKFMQVKNESDLGELDDNVRDVPALRPSKIFGILKNIIESDIKLKSEADIKFRIGTVTGYDYKVVTFMKEASTISIEWEKHLDADFLKKTFNTNKALVAYPADYEDAIDVTFVITFKDNRFHLSMSASGKGAFKPIASGVSIDELTAKAKLEMVKVGKSGKVFGNKD